MKIGSDNLIVAATLVGAFAGSLAGCASAAPAELVSARNAYAVSSGGLAAKLTPTELYDAKNALDRADQELADHGDTNACRDYAYIAARKVELADAKARTELDLQKIAEAVKAGVTVRNIQPNTGRSALLSTR
jgi:hypothetical protein